MLVGAGCTERPAQVGAASLDSAELAARRQAFLAEQEARTRAEQQARRFQSELFLEQPTVVAFYPAVVSAGDNTSLREHLKRFEATAAAQGWAFEERHSRPLRLTDPSSQALYSLPLPAESMGLVLAAPGFPPQVWYGTVAPSDLAERLQALQHWLPGRAQSPPVRI